LQPLRGLKPERVNVGQKDQHGRELLAAGDDSELGRTL
jgi:hypothetical protein